MDYTQSNAFTTHVGTGHRMHQASAPVTTEVSDVDMNQLIWSVMKVLETAGISAAAFDPGTPATYNRLLLAIQALAAGTNSFGATSHVALPGGLILKFGSYTSDLTSGGSAVTITFGLAFPNACRAAIAMPRNPTPDGSADAWVHLRSKSTTTAVFGADWAGSGGTDTVHGFDWLAIGN